MAAQLVLGRRLTLTQNDPGLDGFTSERVGDTSHTGFGDRGMVAEHFFYFAGPDLIAAGLDQVLLAIGEEDVAVLVHVADVASVKPESSVGTAAQRLRRFLRVAPVGLHQLRRGNHQLASFATRHLALARLRIDDLRLD